MSMHLHQKAFEHAQELIKQKKIIIDDDSKWHHHNQDQLKEKKEKFLASHSVPEYGLWFLGILQSHHHHDLNNPQNYSFPYGDFEQVHKGALMYALKQADKHHYRDIKAAVEKLLNLIDKKS